MKSLEQLIKIVHGSKFLHDSFVVADVVTVIVVGGGINRVDPHHIDPETFQIIQFRYHAPEIAYAIAIAVLKTSRIDLVHNWFLPPFLMWDVFILHLKTFSWFRLHKPCLAR